MNILCIDPGPKKSGYAILETGNWKVIKTGVVDWDELIGILLDPLNNIKGVALEKIILYSFAKGAARVNNSLLDTTFQCGRLYQKAKEAGIEYREAIRAHILQGLTGLSPHGKGNKITKAYMQQKVKFILYLEKVVSPQHANDAICAGLYLWKHSSVVEWKPKGKNGTSTKKTKRGKRKGKQMALCID